MNLYILRLLRVLLEGILEVLQSLAHETRDEAKRSAINGKISDLQTQFLTVANMLPSDDDAEADEPRKKTK